MRKICLLIILEVVFLGSFLFNLFHNDMNFVSVKSNYQLVGNIEEDIPDENFRACLKEMVTTGSKTMSDSISGEDYTVYYTSNGTTYDDLTDDNLSEIVGVYCANKNISDLKGIELLTNVTSIDVSSNPIKKVSLSSTTNPNITKLWLKSIDMKNFSSDFSVDNTLANHLTVLDVGNNNLSSSDFSSIIRQFQNLTDLSVRGNKISGDINVSGLSHLKNLWIEDNDISSLTGVDHLEILNVANSDIKTLDFSNHNSLTMLTTSGCNIPNLDLSSEANLKYLYANSMDLKNLKFHNDADLVVLDVSSNKDFTNNQIQEWVTKFKNLERFFSSSNNLTALDLKNNTKLIELDLSHNRLSNLVLPSSNTLKSLNLSVNDISSLDLSSYTNLESLFVSNLKKLENLDLSNNVNLKVFNGAFSSFGHHLNLDYNVNLSSLTFDYEFVKKMDFSKFPQLETVSLVDYKVIPVYGENYAVSSIQALVPKDIHYERYEFYSSFDHNTLFNGDVVNYQSDKAFPLRLRGTGVTVDFNSSNVDFIFEGYYEVRFIKISSDKYAINEEKATIEVGSDNDEDIKKNLSSSWDEISFDISGNQLVVKYNGQDVKKFTLQRVVNPKTGSSLLYGIIFMLIASCVTLFVVYTKGINKINNEI